MTPLQQIKAFAFDVDGVLTDGGILCDLGGELYRTYDAKDGFAIRMAVMNGFPTACITGGHSETIRLRLMTSGLKSEDVYLGARFKVEQLDDFCTRYGISPREVMYFGDDLPDLCVFRAVGCSVCPADAVEEVRQAADIVSDRPGGKGCLRQEVERVMKLQGRWIFDEQVYKKLF